jgi:aldose 1-epimerase
MASDCTHLVVYDQPAHALCVEPETGPPDAFNLGLAAVVAPGRPLVATTTWSWKLG